MGVVCFASGSFGLIKDGQIYFRDCIQGIYINSRHLQHGTVPGVCVLDRRSCRLGIVLVARLHTQFFSTLVPVGLQGTFFTVVGQNKGI